MIFEFDDFGCNHIISDQCQSHDCRDQLDKLHILNPAFKATLFAIPGEMTPELLNWCRANSSWIELAWHGFFHTSNYECEKLSYGEFDEQMHSSWAHRFEDYAQRIFRAPGWQISDGVLEWLYDNDWIIADQGYNDMRRPIGAKSYVNYDGVFKVRGETVEAYHGHTWDVGWNGIYEDFDKVSALVKDCKEFKFVSEVF
jgi:hypothetical protein